MNNQPSFSTDFTLHFYSIFAFLTFNSAPQFHILLLSYYHSAFSTVGFMIYLTNWLFKLFFFFKQTFFTFFT